MTCYIVTFQTISEVSRKKVRELLRGYRASCPVHKYCWAIKTEDKATQIRDLITTVMAQGERVFVIRSGTEAAWFNSYGEKTNKWLKKNL